MNKKNYLLIIWIITLICIIGGVIIHFSGCFNTGIFHVYRAGKFVTDEQSFGNVEVNEINIKADIGDIDISYGDTLEVKTIYPEKHIPTVTYKDGVLDVKAIYHSEINLGLSAIGEDKYSMNIVIPRNSVIKNTSIEVDLGDVDMNDVDSEKLYIDNKLGDIEVRDSEGKSADLVLSLGNLKVNNGKYTELDVDNSLGDINIDGDFQNIDLVCDGGDVDVKTTGKTDYVKVVNNLGDIDLNGDFDTIDASCDLGDIDIVVKGEVDKNKISIKSDLGDVTVNGEDWQKLNNHQDY